MRLSCLPTRPARPARLARLARLVCLAAALLLCACGSSSSSSSSSSPRPSASGCPQTDSLKAIQASVQAEGPQSTVEQTVSPGTHESLACGTTVSVTAPSGKALAKFGAQGTCQLETFDNQPASIKSRDPAEDLLTLNAGELSCTVPGPINHPTVVPCPDGTIVVKQGTWLQTICVPGATFVVSVYRGSAEVKDKEGHLYPYPVSAGREVYFDFNTSAFISLRLKAADLSKLKNLFSSLAAESG